MENRTVLKLKVEFTELNVGHFSRGMTQCNYGAVRSNRNLLRELSECDIQKNCK